jgi:hypothetical protein
MSARSTGVDGFRLAFDRTVHFHDGAGHFTPLECAGEFARLIRGCLGQVQR